MSDIRMPSVLIYDAPRASNDKTINYLIVVTDAGSLPSVAIFDSIRNITDFTTGKGYHFAYFTARSEEEAQMILEDFSGQLADFVTEQTQKELTLKGRKFGIKPRPTPPNP